MNKLEHAFNFRHACKIFDNSKKIPQQDLQYILEAGRKSPSSFGLEPWHFVVVSNEQLKEQLKPICYNQKQITSCSHIVIILYRKSSEFTLQSQYLRDTTANNLAQSENFCIPLDDACQYFIDFYQNGLAPHLTLDHWSEMQCYIPAANMMTAAAYINIDSCAIGGFNYDNMTKFLVKNVSKFNQNSFGIALCLTLGYRLNEQQPKQIRWDAKNTYSFLE